MWLRACKKGNRGIFSGEVEQGGGPNRHRGTGKKDGNEVAKRGALYLTVCGQSEGQSKSNERREEGWKGELTEKEEMRREIINRESQLQKTKRARRTSGTLQGGGGDPIGVKESSGMLKLRKRGGVCKTVAVKKKRRGTKPEPEHSV